MNNRRKLVIALGAGALAAPLSSFAQQQGKVWRIGFLSQSMWFQISVNSGFAEAGKSRDFTAIRMTTQQIAEAQKLARECQQGKFKGCD